MKNLAALTALVVLVGLTSGVVLAQEPGHSDYSCSELNEHARRIHSLHTSFQDGLARGFVAGYSNAILSVLPNRSGRPFSAGELSQAIILRCAESPTSTVLNVAKKVLGH